MENPQTEKLSDEEESSAFNSPAPAQNSDSKDKSKFSIRDSMYTENSVSKTRLLEYRISLNVEVDELSSARQQFLSLLSENKSFLTQAQTYPVSGKEYMNVQIFVPVSNLIGFLKSVQKIGNVNSETINTEDHTEANELQKIVMEREEQRGRRRNKAVSSASSANWNWKDREDALERSEDGFDHAKLEKWKIQDKVSFAKVSIQITGKKVESDFELLKAVKKGWMTVLEFLEALISIWPFLILGLILFWYFRYRRNRI
ncbi:MAG TPA: DUF4349 domain-containing protein [Leptospiraceae bacterium]|nr:DUF4349 domain-containing protein [Leptospiraceae bacterium]HMY68601.1 DUF4349 domain-containing protein [Leptospiraceae bacterium]HNF13450.1 DUF4349 domain-containing protein [Leptospiraceae bacterium]HNF25645.1 DUF4349 domain-containing protein [Leptospiraceae bacterium]HNI96479.1 DUF4349 domain-containing protein [Leptospiraceae bacterium]